jgi:hypothetical protein
MAAALLVFLGGCAASESTPAVADYGKVRAMGGMYGMYMGKHKGQAPPNEQAFREWLNTKQDPLQQAGLTVDQMFVSPRNGQPLEWVYGRKPPTSPSGMTCIAYEKTPVGGKRLVLATRGMYEEMDESQFSKVFPKAPK